MVGLGLLFCLLWVSDRLVYLVEAARFEGELLYGRVPIDDVVMEPEQMEKLALVPEIKRFGERIGLKATQNYDTINPTWDRTIWNVSASEPLRFENRSWWFPIVGSVPYLGFFDKAKADALVHELEADGLDAYARTAGAFSTLGWFRDPLTPNMLAWSEYQLANTILHELAHATVWVPGSVQFNESFANFVGDRAADAYLRDRYGDDSPEVTAMVKRLQDTERWRTFMQGVYRDLDAIYTDPALTDEQRYERKAAVYGGLEARIRSADFDDPERFVKSVNTGTWNNARMMQYRTYNRSRDWFAALYERNDRDLLRFMHAVRDVTGGSRDPYRALALAVGADPDLEE